MRILSVTAQKAESTGSGVFLTELVKGFHKAGFAQAVVCGTAPGEMVNLPEGVSVFPAVYQTEELPFPVCGMSDEMPYESTRYRDMTQEMTDCFRETFSRQLQKAVAEFRPDVILCHHLYYLAALTRELFPELPVYGQCHGSDLRQFRKNSWQREYISRWIPKLNGIFALHGNQKQQICQTYGVPEDYVTVMGTGYNADVFRILSVRKENGKLRLIFAGKLSEKKGVFSLLRALHQLKQPEQAELMLAGGTGNREEYETILSLTESAPCRVTLLGKLNHTQLVQAMNEADVFVLPSFFEGLPLVLLEAMACGLRVVCTDLPGIRDWMEEAVPGNGVLFVAPPDMVHEDEPRPEDLPAFERRLAEAMEAVSRRPLPDGELVKSRSWDSLCRNYHSHWHNN